MQRLRSGRLGRKHPRHSQPVTEPTASEQCHLADTHSQLQCHLTSWPPDVLEYFIASITDAQQLCTLSLVCKATRTVVKSAHCPIILRLPCASPDTAAQQLAAEAVAGTRLRIQGAQPESAEQQRGRHRPPAHIAAQTVLSRLPPGALRRVTTVELRGLTLDTLVPSWLHLVGPQVTTLVIKDCYITQLPAQAPTPCPTIRSLHISQCTDSAPDSMVAATCEAGIRAQLSALPSLEELTLGWVPTLLRLMAGGSHGFRPRPIEQLFPETTLTTLQRLDLPWCNISDADMRTLLSMPALKDVGFGGMRLTQDYSQRGCQWEQITCMHLCVPQLAQLPLHALQSLRLRSEDYSDHSIRPGEQKGMQLWAEHALCYSPTTSAIADTLHALPSVTIIPPIEHQRSQDLELVIVVCPHMHDSPDIPTQLAVFERFWRTLTQSVPEAVSTVTLQLREVAHFQNEYIHMLTGHLTRVTPPSVLTRLRVELWQCYRAHNITERMLHVVSGLPVVLTLRQEALFKAVRAVACAPRGAQLTVQIDGSVDAQHASIAKHELPAAAARAGVQVDVVYLWGVPKAQGMWQDASRALSKVSAGVVSASQRWSRCVSRVVRMLRDEGHVQGMKVPGLYQ